MRVLGEWTKPWVESLLYLSRNVGEGEEGRFYLDWAEEIIGRVFGMNYFRKSGNA